MLEKPVAPEMCFFVKLVATYRTAWTSIDTMHNVLPGLTSQILRLLAPHDLRTSRILYVGFTEDSYCTDTSSKTWGREFGNELPLFHKKMC